MFLCSGVIIVMKILISITLFIILKQSEGITAQFALLMIRFLVLTSFGQGHYAWVIVMLYYGKEDVNNS